MAKPNKDKKSNGGGGHPFPSNFKKRKKDSERMERQEAAQVRPEAASPQGPEPMPQALSQPPGKGMGSLFTPDRSGTSSIRDRGR